MFQQKINVNINLIYNYSKKILFKLILLILFVQENKKQVLSCFSTPMSTTTTTTILPRTTTTTSTTTTSTTTTTTTTTTTGVCMCPAGTSGIIYNSTDPRIIQLNMPPASATCGGCPTGYIESCYPTQPSSNPANDISNIDVQCGGGVPNYSTFCACPSDGQQCFTFGQSSQVFDVQLYTFCDSTATCLTYLIFFSTSNTDFLNNNVQSVTFIQENTATGNLVPFSQTSPYVKAPTIAVSCDGCNSISTNNANTGTSVKCSGPLTTSG